MIDWDRIVLAPLCRVFGEGDPVVFTPISGASEVLTGDAAPVFNDRFLDESFDNNGMPVSTTKPVLGLRAAALSRLPVQGDSFTVRGRAWVATNVDPDGQGHLLISLRLAQDPA